LKYRLSKIGIYNKKQNVYMCMYFQYKIALEAKNYFEFYLKINRKIQIMLT